MQGRRTEIDLRGTMIHIANLTKIYNGTTAVQSLSLSVAQGETLVLLGTSGCGKTTTLKMINRLVEPTSGSIAVEGVDVRSVQPEKLRRSIGYVIQHGGLFPHYTVAENIAIVPRLLGWDDPRIRQRTTALAEQLHLPPEELLHKYPHQLSGGQQQRVGLARALAANPPIVLLDEPFGALDPVTRASIRREFRQMDELKSKTTVLVTHDIAEACELGDRICLMDKGEIQQIGTPKELLFAPANNFVRAFFSGQRLQLQLAVLTVKDIAPHIALMHRHAAQQMENTTLWEAMEHAIENPATSPLSAGEIVLAAQKYRAA